MVEGTRSIHPGAKQTGEQQREQEASTRHSDPETLILCKDKQEQRALTARAQVVSTDMNPRNRRNASCFKPPGQIAVLLPRFYRCLTQPFQEQFSFLFIRVGCFQSIEFTFHRQGFLVSLLQVHSFVVINYRSS